MLTEQVLGVFAVWLSVTLATFWVITPRWAWYLIAALLGCGWELLVDPSTWWLGVGVGGGAMFLMALTDLIMVATDSAKVTVLRQSRRNV
jgi:hypothetical protein